MIWRDDDIGKRTVLEDLRAVDDIFQHYRVPHTIAVMAEGMDTRPDLVELIRTRGMIAQLHCWTHVDLTNMYHDFPRHELKNAVELMGDLFGIEPTVLYPPWNKSNRLLEMIANGLGMTVSHKKISLDQYLRCGGDATEDTINFHYWHTPDVVLLERALQLEHERAMKITDYCPRAAPFDTYLKGRNLVGVEVGVDVGAHAQALLDYCDVDMIHLVDPWPNPYCRGYCESRLMISGYRSRFRMLHCGSIEAASKFTPESLDFIYIDQEHDAKSVTTDLVTWWPKLKTGGVLGYRNYSATPTPLVQAVDAWIANARPKPHVHPQTGEMVLVKV